MRLLITGGAGYIGSHVAREATLAGHDCVIIDNLSTGNKARVSGEFHDFDLANPDAPAKLKTLFANNRFDSVIHLAARKQVGESVEKPEEYYRDNIGAMANLLLAMRESDHRSLVFSSSAATYGFPDAAVINEDVTPKPINPYGETKLIGEWMVENAQAWGLRGVNLRYFNVAGCGYPELNDTAALNLIPILIHAIKAGKPAMVFGEDYPTPDGSCIRDYVHVSDLALAHLAAVEYLEKPEREFATFNVGTGVGASVFEVVTALKQASGVDFEVVVAGRRAGDPPRLVADVSRITKTLGFRATRGLTEIVESAWQASL
jgi:UDP-glucose 4-epimerase